MASLHCQPCLQLRTAQPPSQCLSPLGARAPARPCWSNAWQALCWRLWSLARSRRSQSNIGKQIQIGHAHALAFCALFPAPQNSRQHFVQAEKFPSHDKNLQAPGTGKIPDGDSGSPALGFTSLRPRPLTWHLELLPAPAFRPLPHPRRTRPSNVPPGIGILSNMENTMLNHRQARLTVCNALSMLPIYALYFCSF
jgi:hypothetical protein